MKCEINAMAKQKNYPPQKTSCSILVQYDLVLQLKHFMTGPSLWSQGTAHMQDYCYMYPSCPTQDHYSYVSRGSSLVVSVVK